LCNNKLTWQSVPFALLQRVLRLYLSSLLDHDYIPNLALCQRVFESLSKKYSQITVSGNLVLEVADGIKILVKQVDLKALEVNWSIKKQNFGNFQILWAECEASLTLENEYFAKFSQEILSKELLVRQWQAGDKIKCVNGITKKVKKIFNTARISIEERANWPIFCDKLTNEIIWIPGLARSKFWLVTDKDEKVVLIKVYK
ncbi:MAG: tRNA lysidine(34) synthetase TilS, partial [Lentisphaeria bacterium]